MSRDDYRFDKILLKACIDSPDDMIILAIDRQYNYMAFNTYHKKVMKIAYGIDIKPEMNLMKCMTNNEDIVKAKLNYGKAFEGESHITTEEFGEIDRQYYETRYNPIYNEINEIIGATAFSYNVTDRKKIEKALIQSETRYRELIDMAPDGILLGSAQGIIIGANSKILKISGRKLNEILGLNIEVLFTPEELSRVPLRYELLLEGKVVINERILLRPDGESVPIEMHTRMMPDGSYQSILHDITERRKVEENLQQSLKELGISRRASLKLLDDIRVEMEQRMNAEQEVRKINMALEQRVAERTAQLESANKELEAFAYSVSHDLRAPLRAVDGFSKYLLDDYRTKLDPEGARLLALIRSNTQKMDQLIVDILALSRVSRNALKISKVDMVKMSLSMLNEVASPEIQNKIKITIGKMPEASADSTYLKQVWINLISNAIKFSSKKSEPEIEFGGYADGSFHIYFVRDNGAGFKQDYAHKLFRVFQRLHKADEFEGNGVGLAIVQRIIHRHGGRVWAEGKEGQGATFFFSLPDIK
jgi:PAS domain S-box-containing protein